jgi:hypothetical protein
MHRHARQIAAAAGLQSPWSESWSWRHAATLLLLLVTVPVFLGAALMASVVVVPMLLLLAIGEAVQISHLRASTSRQHSQR